MALIGTLRNKMGKVVVGAIMITMLSFIMTDLIGNSSLLGGQNLDIAEIGARTITNEEFQTKVRQVSESFGLITGRNPSGQEVDGIRNGAWSALILESAYEPQFGELGIEVTAAEVRDMVQGNNISPQIQQNFANPETGEFSVENVVTFLQGLRDATPQQQRGWVLFESSLAKNRLALKYESLLKRTNYVTKYESKDEYLVQNASATFEYVYVPFLSMPDSSVTFSQSDLDNYMDDHSFEYEREGSRNADYVIFEIDPSVADTLFLKEEVAEIRDGLISSANDSSYVLVNSDDLSSFITYNEGQLPESLKEEGSVREPGYVSEPEIVNGAYEFYKLSRKDILGPDSVLFRVAKIKKNFFASDETINEAYRKADLFAASVSNVEEFMTVAAEQNLTVLNAKRVDKNDKRFGTIQNGRTLASWLYNTEKIGKVSEVKEVDNMYIVAVITGEQEQGIANVDDVRNEVITKVRNEKKSKFIIEKLNNPGSNELSEVATNYGSEARTGTTDVRLFSNNATGIGYAPEAIGLGFALNEEENTRAFAVQDGVLIIKLIAKNIPEDIDDYSTYQSQIISKRLGTTTVIADFPLTYFRVSISTNIDKTIKEFSNIEDMRYKFF